MKIHKFDCNHCQIVYCYGDAVDDIVKDKGDTPYRQWQCNHCQTVRSYDGDTYCIAVPYQK